MPEAAPDGDASVVAVSFGARVGVTWLTLGSADAVGAPEFEIDRDEHATTIRATEDLTMAT